jgi:hypothetical protein
MMTTSGTHQRHVWTLSTSAALAGISAVLAFFAVVNRSLQFDDAFIYYRYVRNVLSGFGLVYNTGEYFNALSSPLHTYLSIPICGIAGSVHYPMVVQSAFFSVAAIVVMFVLYSKHEPRWPFVLFGAALIAGWRYFHSLLGMETPLFLFLTSAVLLLYERRKMFWLGITCALLVLTRGEGLFLVLILAAVHLARRRPLPRLLDFVAPSLLLGGHTLFHKLYYGSFLPHTLTAKIDHGRSGLWGEKLNFFHVEYQLDWFFEGSFVVLGIFVALVVLGIRRLGRTELNFVVLTYLTALAAFYLVLNVLIYHWYYAPMYLFGCMYAGLGLASLYSFAERAAWVPLARLARIAVVALGAGVLVWVSYVAYAWPASAIPPKQYPVLGQWLKQNTPPDASVAMVEVGIVGYYSERYIVDILGVVSPKNAESVGRRRFGEWLENYEPDYILVHMPLWPHEQSVVEPARQGRYRAHEGFDFLGFRLLVREDYLRRHPPLRFIPRSVQPGTGG